jgi:hypothetical protein
MNMRGMGCALYIRCALSIHQKECRKILECALYIGARYLPENTVICWYFVTFPEKGLGFEPTPARKDEKAGRSVEDIWPRKTENSVMFICVLN